MSCPGLHCPGCSGGQSLGILAGVVVLSYLACETVAWVYERIWWIAGGLAVIFVLSVVLAMWIGTLTERREARFSQLLANRQRVAGRVVPAALPPAGPPAIAPAFRDLHIHLDGVPSPEQAAVIRQALNGGTR